MKVFTAIDTVKKPENSISCFLAGGITNCDEWQDKVIDHLMSIDDSMIKWRDVDFPELVIINPRRKNFPIGDPNAANEQITWEYNALSDPTLDIFSMYFCAGTSDQPICMYELGRYTTMFYNRYSNDIKNHIVVSVEDGYKRQQDVNIQLGLIPELSNVKVINWGNAEDHAFAIYTAYIKCAAKKVIDTINPDDCCMLADLHISINDMITKYKESVRIKELSFSCK